MNDRYPLSRAARIASLLAFVTTALTGLTGCTAPSHDRGSAGPPPAGAAADRPNVVLIMADDLGWGDTGYNGSPLALTPNLDAMAARGVRLDRFYAAAPVCSPTRGSVLTGRHPYRYGIFSANVGHLPETEITLAEVLRDVGYRNGFFGKWHLGILTRDTLDANRGGRPEHARAYAPPARHGFDTVFATESKTPTFDPLSKPKVGARQTWWDAEAPDDATEPFGTHYWNERGERIDADLRGDDSKIIVDRALAFIEAAVGDRVPFLAVIWVHAPHLPVVAAAADRAAIASDEPYTNSYFGSILAMDREIGRVRETLRRLGVADDTLLWFSSDNGPEHIYPGGPGSSGGLRGAKRSLFEGGIRVPGIVEWPGRLTGGRRVGAPLVTSDIFPTVLDYLGTTPVGAPELDGISARRLLEGDATGRGGGIGFESGSQIAWIEDRYKLVHQPAVAPSGPNLQGEADYLGQNRGTSLDYALYDLVADPAERTDLSRALPERARALETDLARWRASVARSIRERNATP